MALLEVRGLRKTFFRGAGPVVALDGVSLTVPRGGTLGVIGESGSGKSTLARIVLGLETADAGDVVLPRATAQDGPARLAAVFQEPYESLDPRMTVLEIVREPLDVLPGRPGRRERDERARAALLRVGLDESLHRRRPRGLSGGQQQRVGIARAIVAEPQVVVLDEPTSSLDVSIRADVLGLLTGLQAERGLTYLFISHDIGTIAAVSTDVAVLYRGVVVESGRAGAVLRHPQHPYTRLLMAAQPVLRPVGRRPELPVVVNAGTPASGCPFAPRCPHLRPDCTTDRPELRPGADGSAAACVLVPARAPVT